MIDIYGYAVVKIIHVSQELIGQVYEVVSHWSMIVTTWVIQRY